MPINYVVCAAGEGSRFQDYSTRPKPTLVLKERSLLEWALDSLPITIEDRVIVLTQKKHFLKKYFLDKFVIRYPFFNIVFHEIDVLTRGQLETALLAKEFCKLDSGLVVYNCDSYFQHADFLHLTKDPTIKGIVPCSVEEGESWSFCKTNQNGELVEIAEKRKISNLASIGLYYFSNSKIFFDRVEEYILNFKTGGEIFVAPFYDFYLNKGEKVLAPVVELFKAMGTPEQLFNYWKVDKNSFLSENPRGTVVVDLDNTITVDSSHTDYDKKLPNMAVVDKLRDYKKNGYSIIIYSSRRMKTFGNDEAMVIGQIGFVTIKWLQDHNVPFDGIRFGKPYASDGFYVDDKAIRPDEFVRLSPSEISKLEL